jgi:anti-anti-sigma factor
MPINQWSDNIIIAELNDEPAFSEDMESLERQLRESPRPLPSVIANMQAVSYLNSSNIAQLLRVRKALNDHGGKLRLCAIDDSVWSLLMVAGLDKIFECNEDVSTALAALQIGA